MDLLSLEDGAYILTYEAGSFSENVKYGTADFNKLYVRKVRLPSGRGNIVYLLGNTFNESLNMIKNENFIIPPGYRRVYYPQYLIGSFLGRRYRVILSKVRASRNKFVKDTTKRSVYPARVLGQISDNIFFVTSDLYEAVKPILEKKPIKVSYTEFFKQFTSTIKGLSPEVVDNGKGPEHNNRILIIDTESFKFKNGAPLSGNKTNPLFLLYLAYFRSRDLSKLNVNMDMMICSRNMFIKFNPISMTQDKWAIFRRALFRIMNANLDNYTDSLSEDDKKELGEMENDKVVSALVSKAVAPYIQNVSASTKEVLQTSVEKKVKADIKETLRKDIETKLVANEVDKKIDMKAGVKHTTAEEYKLTRNQQKVLNFLKGDFNKLATDTDDYVDDVIDYDDYEEDIQDDVAEIMSNDTEVAEEVLDEIQEENVPMNNQRTSPINSERDKKLREEQKKVVVKNKTIEEILATDSTNVPIETSDKSKVMHTINKNMTQITFANFDKTYIDELYMKDIVSCFDFLKDKEYPFYVTGVEVKDTSNNLDFKDTWSVHIKDEMGKRTTIKIDIPKFQNDRFMLIQGNRYIILKQNFYNPLVKDTPDEVIITTNFNKVTVRRQATKSLSDIERIFSLIKKNPKADIFTSGNSSVANMRFISSLEYDELSRRLFKYSTKDVEIIFSREYLKDNFQDPKGIKGDEFFIGHIGDTPIFINEDTGLDREGRTICQIIEETLPENMKEQFESIKSPSQSMYVQATMAGQDIPVIVALVLFEGLKKSLDDMGIKWRFTPGIKKPKEKSSMSYVRFSDGLLEYEPKIFAELILNGFKKIHPENYTLEDFESETGCEQFVYSVFGTYNGITELRMFKEFLVDPITKSVCHDLSLPDTASGLLINAVKLLADNSCVSKASDKSYRVRSIEMIPAILYGCLAAQYKSYVKSGRRIPMTLNQRCVISKLIQEKTVEAYSTLNPVVEVKRTHTISTKGYKGSNSEFSYDEQKRSYDPSAVGKIAITTSPDKNVGVTRELVIEPTIKNARGYRADDADDITNLKDINLFSPSEILTPGTIRSDDPIRSAINKSCRCKTA